MNLFELSFANSYIKYVVISVSRSIYNLVNRPFSDPVNHPFLKSTGSHQIDKKRIPIFWLVKRAFIIYSIDVFYRRGKKRALKITLSMGIIHHDNHCK